MKLHFRILGEGAPLLVLHGVFGSSDNWQSVGKELSKRYKVYLIDQRNHGRSPHDPEMDYLSMSDDIEALCEDEGIDQCQIIGHSMGGKTAMYFACRFASRVSRLVVVDIAPKYYIPHHQQIFKAFHAVHLDAADSRSTVDKQVAQVLPDVGVRQFILKNLQRGPSGFEWKINLQAIESHIEDLGQGLPDGYLYGGETLFIRGTNSDYIEASDEPQINSHFPKATVTDIQAGHWVHAEKPMEMLKVLNDFLD